MGRGHVRVDDVDDTVGDKDIGCDDLGAVDEDGAVDDGDGHFGALHGCDHGVVCEAGAVGHGAVNDWGMLALVRSGGW